MTCRLRGRCPVASGAGGTRCARTGTAGRARTPRSTCARRRRTRPASFAASGERDLDEHVLDGLTVSPRVAGARDRMRRRTARQAARASASRASSASTSPRRCSAARASTATVFRTSSSPDRRPPRFPCRRLLRLRLLAHRVPAPSAKGLRRGATSGTRSACSSREASSASRSTDASRQFFRRWIADSWSGVVFSARELSRRLERCGFRVTEIRGAGTQYLRATAIKPG